MCMTSREDESRCQLDEHISPSLETGEKGRRDEVMGDHREGRGGLKGGHWSKSSREKVSSLPACLPARPPARLPSPGRLKSCEENKVYCLERGGKKHVKSIKAMEVNN